MLLKSQTDMEDSFSYQHVHEDLGWGAYLCVTDANALHVDFVRRGVRVSRPPEDTLYGFRDFEVEDLDGHLLCVDQDLSGPPSG